MKTVIITDSTCDLTYQQLEQLNVEAVPLTVNFSGKSYRDGVDITKSEFFDMLESSSENPTTSQPSPEEFLKLFEKHKEQGNHVVYIGISSVLSGTVQSARIAKDMCDYDNIYIVDSLSATAGIEILLRLACEMRDNGMTAEKIAEELATIVPKIRIFAYVDTLKYLVRGGRVSRTAGAIGGALGVKPLIAVADGAVLSIGTARGQKGAFDKLCNIVKDADIDTTKPFILFHSRPEENMQLFEAYMLENGINYDMLYGELGSVIGTHIGPGAVAVAYVIK
ncbi:MAG: DegV family protein [Oscillospiraceae bacterium]|nr:DegV family protein [Oscillospiraceae bacterium]